MGDRVVVLDKGIIQQADTPEKIYNNPSNTFVAAFVGSPQMNFIDADKAPKVLCKGKYTGKTDKRGRQSSGCIGIRPEKMVCGGGIKFKVDIEMTELLGSEQIVYFEIGSAKCCAKLPADYKIDKRLELSIRPEDLYFFDDSGKRV
jgi:multiple sugar transport system ATP-binding protein